MQSEKKPNRRTALRTGLATVAAGFAVTKRTNAAPKPKAKGETKVVYLGGDQLHNGLGQSQSLRGVLAKLAGGSCGRPMPVM